jgi:hypothetical protein
MSMNFLRKLPIPKEIKKEYPLSAECELIKNKRDEEIAKIFRGESDKLVMIIGPCSADREDAVMEYIYRLARVQEQIKDKIVVIGDFKSDVHTTYAGPQPGSSMCINAYLMLMEGNHFVNWLNIFMMFIIYTMVGTFYLRGASFQTLFANPWMGLVMSFFSTATLFFIIAIIAFWHDVAFNMWVPTTIYSLIDTYIQKRNLFKNKKKNEKARTTPAV